MGKRCGERGGGTLAFASTFAIANTSIFFIGTLLLFLSATEVLRVQASNSNANAAPITGFTWRESPRANPVVYHDNLSPLQSNNYNIKHAAVQSSSSAVAAPASSFESLTHLDFVASSTHSNAGVGGVVHTREAANVVSQPRSSPVFIDISQIDDIVFPELLESQSESQSSAKLSTEFAGAVCCYARESNHRWLAGFSPQSGGCHSAATEAARLTQNGKMAAKITNVQFMGLVPHFYAKEDPNRSCETLVSNLNRGLHVGSRQDAAGVGGCTGDCGKTPVGLFCCYVVKDMGSTLYRYLGNVSTQRSGCMNAISHYNMMKARKPGNNAIQAPNYTAEYHVCSNPIDSQRQCAEFARKFGRIDPPLELDGQP